MADVDVATQIEAINVIGGIGLALIGLMAIQILLLRFGRPETKPFVAGLYVLWGGLACALAWFAFHPAVRAMGFVSSQVSFVVVGSLAAVILFALRGSRQDLYGLLEIAVGLVTLIILGREYDQQPELTVIIAFVGAVYVMIRGLTNIGDYWKNIRAKG